MKIRSGFVSNSSSESFICRTKDSIESVEKQIKKLLSFYNEWEGRNLQYKKVYYVQKITEELIEDVKDFEYQVPEDATLAINSVSDNSIPYELFEFIESKFNAYRVHLG